jgi:hypothetical protein
MKWNSRARVVQRTRCCFSNALATLRRAIWLSGCGQAPPIPALLGGPGPRRSCKTADNGRGPLQRRIPPPEPPRNANGIDLTEQTRRSRWTKSGLASRGSHCLLCSGTHGRIVVKDSGFHDRERSVGRVVKSKVGRHRHMRGVRPGRLWQLSRFPRFHESLEARRALQ